MGLPAPKGKDIAILQGPSDTPTLRWRDFVRNRKDCPPQAAYGFRLTFDKAVCLPFALGSLAHFGMGQFRAVQPDS